MKPLLLALALLLAACGRQSSNPAPPRVTDPIAIPIESSTMIVPVATRLADLERLLDAEVPATLYEIDRQERACIPAARVSACLVPKLVCEKGLKCRKVGCEVDLKKTKITPDIGCRIVGRVTRGRIRLSGDGDIIRLAMPVSGKVSARDVGNIIKSETATAEAEVRATIRLDIKGDWQPVAKVDIDYDWTEKPGITLLGQRLTFAGRADPELAKVVARLEADLPRHLVKLHPRDALESAWAKGFTVVMLNRKKPPAWLRITPEQLRYNGYRIRGGDLVLDLAATARTETFLNAQKPAPLPPTPLPPPARIPGGEGLRFHLPVIADYAQLEPVLERALAKLSKRPVVLPGNITVRPRFGNVTMYTTTGGRVAIGVAMQVDTPSNFVDVKGTVWLTGQPFNEPGSQRIIVNDLTVAGQPATPAFAVLLAVAESAPVKAELLAGLSQDFARDYAKVLRAAEKALQDKRLGDFILDARINNVVNGTIQPIGQGLYMPVDVTGTGTIRFAPNPETPPPRR